MRGRGYANNPSDLGGCTARSVHKVTSFRHPSSSWDLLGTFWSVLYLNYYWHICRYSKLIVNMKYENVWKSSKSKKLQYNCDYMSSNFEIRARYFWAFVTLKLCKGLSYLEPLVAPFNKLFGATGSI